MVVPANQRHSALLSEARNGNARALETLFSDYQCYLKMLATTALSRHLQSRVTASDVVQETFLRAFEAFDKFRGQSRGEFIVWIRTILASRIADAHEKHLGAARRDVRREVSMDAVTKTLTQSSSRLETMAVELLQASPASTMAKQEDALLIARAVGELPAVHQQVILARHFEGMTFEEIAEQIDRTSGAVRMIWLRAIRKLKERLRETTK
ncbi:sigma-70 family RNA polymerase sigma factor [Roseiconus nitratireducens]|uniref:Sigma-70 family RNA polymerase sigma factor n=1 Tax=Roseiconus nitratireducens TaxID=2605748 RepID=A0A5M6D560_9BACT|nr:sigma-70 family RNA polymerase sigma factor [Roseiconus nitratireducens]KAA5542658.1 sigma-70 family RNA polymerase sigma factor [Roseiconus nitratireducens]